MTRIAEILLALRQAGNVAYSGYVVVINCAAMYMATQDQKEPQLQEKLAEQHVAQLNAHAKEMESALEEWQNKVMESRKCFYELNYYTMRQLLRLRKELSLSRNNPHNKIDPEVLSLLQSISPAVTSDIVHNILTDLAKLKVDLQAAANLVPMEMYEQGMETEVFVNETPSLEVEESCASNAHLVPSPISSPPPPSGVIMPYLMEQDLTDAQKQILTDLVEYQGYPRLLVLKAFEECDETANDYDIADWCEENENLKFDQDKKDEEQNDAAESSEESSSESGSSDGEENDLTMSLQQQQSPRGIHDHDCCGKRW